MAQMQKARSGPALFRPNWQWEIDEDRLLQSGARNDEWEDDTDDNPDWESSWIDVGGEG